MAHHFQDKLFVLMGTPSSSSRKDIRDSLVALGSVADERITTFTHYVVAFPGAEKTKAYKKAVKYDEYGMLVLLNEEQFFNILEGKAEPPPQKTKRAEGVIITPVSDPEAQEREHKQVEQYILAKKRVKNLAKHGVAMPDGSRIKMDFGSTEAALCFAAQLKSKSEQNLCDYCEENPPTVVISGGEDGVVANICRDCHNALMAELTETELPAHVPKHLSFQNANGDICDFEIELEMYPTGKALIAMELGETKRKADVYGELDEDFNTMFETLITRIEKVLSVTYMQPDGYFAESKAVGYIEYNRERDACDIIIDGKPYTWSELEQNISVHEGFKIKIEFSGIGDELD